MKLADAFKAIKEKNLSKDQLEDYHKELSQLRAEMRLELADVTKKKAIFMINNPEVSVAQRKINWSATIDGLREIDLKAYIGATSDNLRSLQTRLFLTY